VQFTGHAAFEFGGLHRVLGAVGVKAQAPLGLHRLPTVHRVPGPRHIGRYFKGCCGPAQCVAGGLHLGRAERGAVHFVCTGLVGRALANHGLAADERGFSIRTAGLLFCGNERQLHRLRVVAIHLGDHIPAAGLETLWCVVGEPAFHVAVDGDAVVVVEGHQLRQPQRAGERTHLVADALHQTTVAEKRVGEMVHHGVAGAVEFARELFLGQRHAHGIADALAQRAGGGLHTRRHAHFGVARRLAVQLAKGLDLAHGQVVAGEVQQRIDQHGAVAIGEHEAVTVGPVGVGRVVAQVAVPQHLGDVGHAHGCAGVTGVGLLHRVHREHADRVGHLAGEFGRWVFHVRVPFAFRPAPWLSSCAPPCAR